MTFQSWGLRGLAVGLAALGLAACATSTPYAPAAESGGFGFSEQRIESNRYRIMFRGNSSTTREAVETSLLYRAADLTLINGFDHFIVVEQDTEENTSVTTSGFGGPAYFGRYNRFGGFYGFPYYAYGFGWGSQFDSFTQQEITRYSAVAFVTMHKGPKPQDNSQAFDAREVSENLRPAVLGAPK